ncbi:MAG: DUF6175 family protein [Paludibacteraceae bacterium]|nr:DUF6175 family protein [Paludibacteraceae bacterium]
MKRLTFFTLSLMLSLQLLNAQAKKPSIMVVPSDLWCNQNGYVLTFENYGGSTTIPDYKKALQTNDQLVYVIAKLGSLMADRGFPLNTLESALARIEETTARNLVMTSKSGASIKENPIDLLNRQARADILMKVTWSVKKNGPKNYVTYVLQAVDPYTGKQVAGAEGVGVPSMSASIDVLIEEAVLTNMDNFCARLQSHFDDLFANGREVAMDIQVWDDATLDLETEFGGKELAEIIDDWIAENTVEHRYSKAEGSETYARYDQMRIALYTPQGKPQDAESFVRQLRTYLRKTFEIECKVVPDGLGHCYLMIGGK